MPSPQPDTWYVGWTRQAQTATLDVGSELLRKSDVGVNEGNHTASLSLSEIKAFQARARRGGVEQLLLAGEEPTLRRDLGAIIRGGTKRGLVLGIRTDGRRFTVPGYAQKMADSGLRYAEVTLMGPRLIHENLVPMGDYDQTSQGIEALLSVGVEVLIRCEVVPENLEHLTFVSDFASARQPCSIAFLCTGDTNADDVTVSERIDGAVAEATKSGLRAEVWNLASRDESIRNENEPLEVRPIKRASRRPAFSLRGVPIATNTSDFRVPEMGRLDTSPRYPDTALITLVVAGCDLNCIFCETPQGDSPPPTSSLSSVKKALVSMRESTTGVYFTGGEPSSVSWIFDAISHAKSLGYRRIQMQSHAGLASDPLYADQLIESGLTAIDIPFYGANSADHEAITNTPGSFERTTQGLRNLRDRGVEVCVHITLFQSNIGALKDVIAFWNDLQPTAGYVQTAGEVGQPGTYEQVAPSPSSVGLAFLGALADVKPLFPLFVTDVAPCHVPEETDRIVRWRGGIEKDSECLVMPYSDWLMTFTGGSARAKGENCDACAVAGTCDGIAIEALHLFGEAELRPF